MQIRPYIPLNFALMANGYNWVILTLMVVTAGLALSILFPSDAEQSS